MCGVDHKAIIDDDVVSFIAFTNNNGWFSYLEYALSNDCEVMNLVTVTNSIACSQSNSE